MKSKAPEGKKITLIWLKRAGILLAILLLAPTLLFTVGWLNRDLLIDELQEWYQENNNGRLEIGEVNATFIYGFPNVGFTIKDIYQTGFDTILDKNSSISIDKAQVSIAATDLLSGNLQFRNIRIENAEIHSEVVSKKAISNYRRLKKQMQSNPSRGLELPGWISSHTKFRLRDVIFVSKDSMLNKYFNLELHDASGEINIENETITGTLDFEVMVQDLGFNTKKGSFLSNTMVSGNPKFILEQFNNKLSVPEFILEVGNQIFTTKADFDFNEVTAYRFSLENPKANFQEIKELLADSIAAKLSFFEILEPLDTKINLEGKFAFGDVPLIDAEFSTTNNRVKINDSIVLDHVDLNGYLTNTLNQTQDIGQLQPSRRDIKVLMESFTGDWDDIKIAASNSYYQSSDESLNYVNAAVKMYGPNETLAKVLQNENFKFIGGNFDLKANINGEVTSTYEVFNAATGSFTLKNTKVVLQKNNLQLPVEIIDLKLNDQNAILENLIINLPNEEQLTFKGTIKNISSLIADVPANPAVADVSLQSDALNINDLIITATEFIPSSENTKTNLKTLHETIEAIYRKFQPIFRLNLNSVEYDSISFDNLVADIEFIDAETVHLGNLSFNYQGAITNLNGTLKIPEPGNSVKEPIVINVATESSGPIKVFQDLFKIQLMDIKSGEFSFSGNVTGNVYRFEQLLNNANGDLKLIDAKFYYPEAAIDIELDALKVTVHDSNINLDRFIMEVGDHHPFALLGRIEEFPGFLLDNLDTNGKIYIALDAAFINIDDWIKTVNSMDFKAADKTLKNRDLAAVFADIYKFNPEFKVAVDSLKYQDIVTRDMAAKVYFKNDSILKLDDLSVRFKDSKALIKGELAAQNTENSKGNQNPFNFRFSAEAEGKSKDLNDLLQTVNFTLQSGDFKFNGSYEGKAQDLEILNSNARGDLILGSTVVDIENTDIQIPVDSLHLYILNNLATLEKLDVELPGKSSIDITGKIDNFSNFINNDQAIESHRSSFNIKSPYLDSRDIKKFLGNTTREKDSSKNQKFEIENLKEILSSINNSYFPSASIEIDSLIYDNFSVSDFTSEIGFNDSGDIVIDATRLNYSDGWIDLMLKAGVGTAQYLPVNIKMNIQDIDIKDLVKDLNYFNHDELRKAEKISGNLGFEFDVNGILNKDGKLDINSLNGTVMVNLKNLALYDYEPLIENIFLLKEERFEKLQLRPIKQSFEVIDGKIIIPRTQVQSTALQFFVEGEMIPGEYYNIWISVPWNNILKSRDGIKLPEKISFENSGAKFYIQVIQDKESKKERKRKLKTKFRLGNRKLKKIKED
ncbi:hypothetical protein [Autumnicola psychrophila]|uniref:AsmA-like C-terminal domain-containing protein n=1 Tax=Autumnicola psychrophila TaxID=3075592 RepID=A0ABU3DYA5_9FLAO|nr:hypothetical protein [Zunongwangia sp. F225]MDT0688032.1 hypothetical protein [Zunongwangia sp. F225]